MRRKHFILFFLAGLVVLSACNQQSRNHSKPSATTDTGKKKSPGKIEFTKEMHNFGTLNEGETVVFSFQFKNNGDLPFRLTKVEPACGCLSVQFSKDEIESQASSVIDVIFQPMSGGNSPVVVLAARTQ